MLWSDKLKNFFQKTDENGKGEKRPQFCSLSYTSLIIILIINLL